jgi:16S rRNA (guanine527-N7)-methyltransferase
MGSGAGFPAVVLAIMGWNVIAIESIGKKADFLKKLKQELELDNLTIFHGRVEDFIKNNKIKNLVFTSRAFASLDKILNYVRGVKNCRLFLLKGREIESEISVAKQNFNFNYQLFPSETGDGFIITIDNIKLFHVK